jgi:peptidoglycan/LPS O-acetylase OafA/YrhL
MADAPGDWLYPLKALLFMDASGTFPGLFADNARTEFSLSLWTLRYEALAYVALPAAIALGLLARPLRAWALWGAVALGYSAIDYFPEAPAIAHEGLRLAAAFLLGGAIHASRNWLRAGPLPLAVALAAAILLHRTHVFEAAANLVLAWALFFVCFPARDGVARRIVGRIVRPLTRMPDWSYGLYIWHWPVFQTLKLVFPETGTGALLVSGFAISLVVAAISWTFLEQPALAGKEALAALFRGLARRTAPRPARA